MPFVHFLLFCLYAVIGISRCECPKGFIGAQCNSHVCEGYCNGHGQCIIHAGNPKCNCDSGYYGKQCQNEEEDRGTESMLCENFACENGGTCQMLNQQPFCNCTAHWNGDNCQVCEVGPAYGVLSKFDLRLSVTKHNNIFINLFLWPDFLRTE